MINNRKRLVRSPSRQTALICAQAAIETAKPKHAFERQITVTGETLSIADSEYDLSRYDDVYVIGGGNVAGHTAAALEDSLRDRITDGAVVTDDPVETGIIEVIEGDYPVPSERCMAGTLRILQIAKKADRNDIVLAIISGGGSQLLSAPVADISLTDLQTVTEVLFDQGVSIRDINVVRKHLSAIKGGQLARRVEPATLAGLVFSDVVGNDLDLVASGPFVPDPSTYGEALQVLDRPGIEAPKRVRSRLERGQQGLNPETPKPGDEVFDHVTHHLLADGLTAVRGACETATELGYTPIVLSSKIRGEAREVAKVHASVAEESQETSIPAAPPAVIVSVGNANTSHQSDAAVGPNQEFALSAAIEFAETGRERITAAAVATDGFDGFAEVAGAVVDSTTVENVERARSALESGKTNEFLAEQNNLVETGATGTNVNNLYLVIVEPAEGASKDDIGRSVDELPIGSDERGEMCLQMES